MGRAKMSSLAYSIADQTFERSVSLGIFNTSLSLLAELSRRPAISTLHVYAHPSISNRLPSGVVTHEVNATGLLRRVHWEQWRVFSRALRDHADWLILPKGFASAIRRPPLKMAAYVHDIMAAIYFDRYPTHGGRWKQCYFAQTLKRTLQSADVILTNTEFSRREILSWAKRKKITSPARVEVVGYGLPPGKSPPTRRDNLILVDVRDWPHKRTDLAVAYLERWRQREHFDGALVCVGRPPKAIALPKDPAWRFAGRISADLYFELMAGARAHVHFTEYEGFGLPPAEAILNGTPAVYSEIEVTREAMSGTGCPFSNADFDSFAAAMSRALSIGSAELTSWQQTLTRRHNWRQTADRVLNALGIVDGSIPSAARDLPRNVPE